MTNKSYQDQHAHQWY